MNFNLAHYNAARLLAPLSHPDSSGFKDMFDVVNAIGEKSPGFIWQLRDNNDVGNVANSFNDPRWTINLSVWESVESLRAFAYKGIHKIMFRNKHQWFEKPRTANYVLWWVPAGTTPTEQEGYNRLMHLRQNGPTAHAFDFQSIFNAEERNKG